MNIISNESLIRRNNRIAQISMVAGLLVLAGGMYVSFVRPEMINISIVTLLVGLILSQVGIYYSNKYGRRPRPDEQISQALKGMDSRNSLYHYMTPVAHLLVGPAGVWVISPRHQRGTISFSKGRWRQKGGNLYMKIFAQEGLGRPDLELPGEVDALRKFLLKQGIPEEQLPDIHAALVFTNPNVVIEPPDEGETPPAMTISLKELKDAIRKTPKSEMISPDKARLIQNAIEDKSPAIE